MAKRIIRLAGVPSSPNPISLALMVGGFVFVFGQTAAGVSGVGPQTRTVLERWATTRRVAGSDLANVVRCGAYRTDMSNFAQLNA